MKGNQQGIAAPGDSRTLPNKQDLLPDKLLSAAIKIRPLNILKFELYLKPTKQRFSTWPHTHGTESLHFSCHFKFFIHLVTCRLKLKLKQSNQNCCKIVNTSFAIVRQDIESVVDDNR